MLSEKQEKILAFPLTSYRALVCHGAIRSGKTSIMTVAFIDWAMRNFDGCNFGICGKSVGSAVMNIVAPYLSLSYARARYKMHYGRSSKLLTVSRGGVTNTFEVAGGNDESSQDNIQGRTWAGVLVDEAALMPQSFVNQATARCSVEGSRLWFNCNPGAPNHWFHREWVKGARERNAYVLHFQLEDNPALTEDVVSGYKAMYSGVFYDRYILGLWTQAEGLVYPNHQDAYEDGFDGKVTDWCVSIDYGTQNPFAAVRWERDEKGVWHATDEYYFSGRESGRQKTDSDYARDMGEFVASLPRGEVLAIVDPSAASFIAELRRFSDKGRSFRVRKARNDVLDGIRDTASAMATGAVKISKSMKRTDEEFKSYVWDEKASCDRPVKESDHAMDAIRYFVETMGVAKRQAPYVSVFERK